MKEKETCPFCGNKDCEADFVDIGVGETQSGPYRCYKCQSYQMDREEFWKILTDECHISNYSDEEKRLGWIRGEK